MVHQYIFPSHYCNTVIALVGQLGLTSRRLEGGGEERRGERRARQMPSAVWRPTASQRGTSCGGRAPFEWAGSFRLCSAPRFLHRRDGGRQLSSDGRRPRRLDGLEANRWRSPCRTRIESDGQVCGFAGPWHELPAGSCSRLAGWLGAASGRSSESTHVGGVVVGLGHSKE